MPSWLAARALRCTGLLAATGCLLGPGPAAAQQPRTTFTGRVLEFDFPGMLVGAAEYDEGPTGITVFYFPAPVMAAVDVRGGAPGTVNTDALRLGYGPQMSAIVLAGSSWHGLAAITGVADAIRALQVERGEAPRIIGVAGAIVNDLGLGPGIRRFSTTNADARLAAAAVRAARPGRFVQGPHGGGRFVMTGGAFGDREFSGQGGAYRQVGATRVAVFTVVNAAGLVVDRSGQIVRCREQSWGARCGTISERLARRVDSLATRRGSDGDLSESTDGGASPNTTITLVVTNQKLEWWALQRLAAQVHTSMARAIQPFATAADGDVLYAVTTGEVDNAELPPAALTLVAGEVAWDAVLSSVPGAPPVTPVQPIRIDPAALDAFAGDYHLGPGSTVTIRKAGERLVAESARGGLYVPPGVVVGLIPTGTDRFITDTSRREQMRFERDTRGRITGVTFNPGYWEIRGTRLEPGR